MFGKQRCYLCGGKLENGRCTACGLDNAKNVQKKYRLNESSRTQEDIRPAGEGNVRCEGGKNCRYCGKNVREDYCAES